ncbi:MAG: phosphatase PAP2 family protein [Candidatus Delongbacteria bacterium]|nr:phosphatase PAP2 family protein [Candidatus Delongbacteria bacterium]
MFFRTAHILMIMLIASQIHSQQDSTRSEIPVSACITPVVLIASGSFISGSRIEKDLQSDIAEFTDSSFGRDIDDFTALAPGAGVFLFDMFGVKAENTFFDRFKYTVIANMASQAVVQSLKYTTDKLRPDGEDRLSFPSNHTNIAFTNAMILWHEYRGSSSLAAYSGFVLAAGTGALRIVHNKHWTGDVLAGAGIGMLCANLVYRFRPLENWHPFGTAERKTNLLPDISEDKFGLTLICNF